jgi:hypothetical protein
LSFIRERKSIAYFLVAKPPWDRKLQGGKRCHKEAKKSVAISQIALLKILEKVTKSAELSAKRLNIALGRLKSRTLAVSQALVETHKRASQLPDEKSKVVKGNRAVSKVVKLNKGAKLMRGEKKATGTSRSALS